MGLVAVDRARDIGVQIKVGRVLSAERNEIAGERQVIADENFGAHGYFEGHRAVIRRTNYDGGRGSRHTLDRKIEHGEEPSSVALDGVLLLLDADSADEELALDRLDQVRVRDRLPAGGRRWCRDRDELRACDKLACGVRQSSTHDRS